MTEQTAVVKQTQTNGGIYSNGYDALDRMILIILWILSSKDVAQRGPRLYQVNAWYSNLDTQYTLTPALASRKQPTNSTQLHSYRLGDVANERRLCFCGRTYSFDLTEIK